MSMRYNTWRRVIRVGTLDLATHQGGVMGYGPDIKDKHHLWVKQHAYGEHNEIWLATP